MVPQTTIATRVTTLQAQAGTKAPFAWPIEIFASVPLLFAAHGSACPVITIPMASDGWEDMVMTFCLPEGAQPILHALSAVLSLSFLAVYVFVLYRRLVGGEGA